MSARTRANKRSKRAAHEMAQQHSEPGWSAIRCAREVVVARDDASRWLAKKSEWLNGYGNAIQQWITGTSPNPDSQGNAVQAIMEFSIQRGYVPDLNGSHDKAASLMLDHIHQLHSNVVNLSELFIVSPDMHQVVEAASATVDFADITTLLRDDITVEHGLLWLPAPQGVHDSELQVRALSWTLRDFQGRPCLIATAWEHFVDEPQTPALVEAWSTIMMLAGERIEPQGVITPFKSLDVAAYIFAFLRLSAQRIVVTPRLRDPDRYPGTPRPHETVRVTKLRSLQAAAQVDGEHHPVDWQHRWVVKMHKVRQWYPSEGVHRVIFRGPFIKGPDGAPLLAGEKVNALVR